MKTSKAITIVLGMTFFLLLSFTYPNLKKRITDTEFRYEFYTTQKEVSAKQDRLYYWFKGGAIHSSEYGVSGELLDGEFEKFYLNNQLAEKGKFKNGLKDGLWKTWHKNGALATKVYCNSGQKSGTFYSYSPFGQLLEKGKYRNDKKHGNWYNYVVKDTVEYKRGEVMVKVPKKVYVPKTKEERLRDREARRLKREIRKQKKEAKKIEKEKVKNESVQKKNTSSKDKTVKKTEKDADKNFFQRLFAKKNKNKSPQSNAQSQ